VRGCARGQFSACRLAREQMAQLSGWRPSQAKLTKVSGVHLKPPLLGLLDAGKRANHVPFFLQAFTSATVTARIKRSLCSPILFRCSPTSTGSSCERQQSCKLRLVCQVLRETSRLRLQPIRLAHNGECSLHEIVQTRYIIVISASRTPGNFHALEYTFRSHIP